MLQAIGALQDAGVEPDIWKIEGLDRREDCERVVAVARREGRDEVGCIVLGRHADDEKVASWLRTAASVPGSIGFAVGRTTFWEAISDYVKKRTTRSDAAARIAQRYHNWVTVFEGARHSHSSAA
jgi:myo-inositol catabolism protein IolC